MQILALNSCFSIPLITTFETRMNSSEILNQHGIKFIKRTVHYKLRHDVDCRNDLLAQFITDYNSVSDALDLSQAFESVLNGQYEKDIVISPTLLTIEIQHDFTSLYHDPEYSTSSVPIVTIDTSAFNEIVKAWAAFLAQPL